MNTNDQLRDYIKREIANGREFSDDDSLLEAGILDSLAIVKLVAHIEDEYDVEIPDADFDPDNFETITAIKLMLERILA